MANMSVSAFLPWAGSKRTCAPRIVKQLGPHRAYWEPFCGSCAVLFAKEESSHETVNDLHRDLANLAWVLQGPKWAELYDRCARSILTEELFRWACASLIQEPNVPLVNGKPAGDLDRAYRFFVRSWWGHNGITGAAQVGDSLGVRFTPGGGHGAIRFRSCVDTMPQWHERLRCVLVLNRDAFGVIESIQDVDGVVIYCDPPYIQKGFRYVHDFEAQDHRRLAVALARFKRARCVVSYYAHQLLADIYPGWTVVDVAQPKFLVNQGMRDKSGATKAPEVLLINGPSLAGDKGLFG